MDIILSSTAWGPKHGGINAFNQDFAIGLASELGGAGNVYCAIPNASDAEVAAAASTGVQVISLPNKGSSDQFDPSWSYEVVDELKNRKNALQNCIWVGHDIVTGAAAIKGAEIGQGRTALLMHMSYVDYQAVKHSSGVTADAKHQEQKKLFRANAQNFAVGPLLQKACKKLTGQDVTRLVPGFPVGLSGKSPDDELVAITFGRMDRQSDPIKRGQLAVSAFASAIEMAHRDAVESEAFTNARLSIIGLGAGLEHETRQILQAAARQAQRTVNILPLPYDENREQLFERLSEANVAMMLSWHEGFGLTGWEAIASEIPLIVTKKSGLYQLVEEELGGAGVGCLHPVEIRYAPRTEEDVFDEADTRTVAKKLIHVAKRLSKCKRDAVELKKLLIRNLGCTWEHTAEKFLSSIANDKLRMDTPAGQAQRNTLSDHRGNNYDLFGHKTFQNGVPQCAELLPGTTQGSTLDSFDLLPELRFGVMEIQIGGMTFSCGLTEALLSVELENCQLTPGPRLGDTLHPNLRVDGNLWRIVGPKEQDILVRRALGDEPLAKARATSDAYPVVSFALTAQQGWISYRQIGGSTKGISRSKEAVLQLFLNKCLGATDGVITLSHASMSVKVSSDEID